MTLDCLKASFMADSARSEEMVHSLLYRVFNNLPTFLKRAFKPVNSDSARALAVEQKRYYINGLDLFSRCES